MRKLRLILAFIFLLAACTKNDFVRVEGTEFKIGGKPYHFIGTNLWYGINLASNGKDGDRARLIRELDHLKSLGINNIRIMAGSEGPDNEPYRMIPSLQPKAGVYNEDVLQGLDFLLDEMKKRDMHAVMCLTNFWNWSGGIPQYLVWSGAADSIPYPPPHPGGNWDIFQKFSAGFYSNPKAIELLNNHIRFIINRTNSISGKPYKEDSVIMTWELANEPRGINNQSAYREWIRSTAALIKSLDGNHLVTVGSEGATSNGYAGNNPALDHQDANIDYVAMHLWVENWSIFTPLNPDSTFDGAVEFARNYIDKHIAVAQQLNKPLVMEEFGISRDLNDHSPDARTTYRDRYFSAMFGKVYEEAAKENSVLNGCNFWTWSGEGRPARIGELWRPGDPVTGEPPHENQGWYSVYDKDSTTMRVISEYTRKINSLDQ